MAKNQINPTVDAEMVKAALEELCGKSGFADAAKLVQRDLEFLCEQIESKSGVSISLSTIKRLLNGQFSRQPQIATLNAIAVSLGYKHWQDFKFNKGIDQQNFSDQRKNLGELIPVRNIDRKEGIYKKPAFLIGAIVLLAIIAAGMLNVGRHPLGDLKKVQFSAFKATKNDIPNTVIFHYNLEGVKADSFFIQQSWDKSRRVRIDNKKHTLTDIYYEPGYHTAKLIANNQVIKTVDVWIPTNGWFYYSKENIPGSLPQYITSSGFKNGCLQMDKKEVLNSQVDIKKERAYINSYIPDKLGWTSDSFDLKFRVKVNILKPEVCPYLMCEVYCQKQFMYFVTCSAGCSSEAQAEFGNQFLNGKTTDFSAMGTNVTTWHDGELLVKNQKVSIFIDHKNVFKTEYQKTCGLITGLAFISNGLCQIDYVSMKTLDGKDIYSNDFNK